MKQGETASNASAYDDLMKKNDKVQVTLEKAKANEKAAKKALKVAEKDDRSKTEIEILRLEYAIAKNKRKSKKAKAQIIKLHIKQVIKTNKEIKSPIQVAYIEEVPTNVVEQEPIQKEEETIIIVSAPEEPKRRRTKKEVTEESGEKKAGRGRSKKEEEAVLEAIEVVEVKSEKKAGRGRPKKEVTEVAKESGEKKTGRGRPRIKPLPPPRPEGYIPKRGRPRKTEDEIILIETPVVAAEEGVEVEAPAKVKRPRRSSEEMAAIREAQAQDLVAGGDNFTLVEGIGHKVTITLHQNGIQTFAQLAQTSVEDLAAIMKAGRNNIAQPETWPLQAQLIIENKHEELRQLQAELKAGRRA
jgi:predicted flap endonuclease-1-like 5' DNA nuclease